MPEKKYPTVDLKYDFAFKYLLGVDENKRFLIRFLNDILQTEPRIMNVEIGNGENPGTYKGDKRSILDIRARTDTGTFLNIEIQVSGQQFIDRRMLYYWSKIYGSQLAQGEHYTMLNKTIGISILDYELKANQSIKYHTTYGLKEIEKDFLLTDVMELHIIELPLFKKQFLFEYDCEIKSPEDFWWLLLASMNKEDINEVLYNKLKEISGGDDLMAKILEAWHKMSKEEAEKYWKVGVGQEMAHYDANIEKDKEIYMKEEMLKEMIELDIPVDKMKKILKLEDWIFDHLYARNKK